MGFGIYLKATFDKTSEWVTAFKRHHNILWRSYHTLSITDALQWRWERSEQYRVHTLQH
jgi:hypothetical protein